jgi:hypothetical protein
MTRFDCLDGGDCPLNNPKGEGRATQIARAEGREQIRPSTLSSASSARRVPSVAQARVKVSRRSCSIDRSFHRHIRTGAKRPGVEAPACLPLRPTLGVVQLSVGQPPALRIYQQSYFVLARAGSGLSLKSYTRLVTRLVTRTWGGQASALTTFAQSLPGSGPQVMIAMVMRSSLLLVGTDVGITRDLVIWHRVTKPQRPVHEAGSFQRREPSVSSLTLSTL